MPRRKSVDPRSGQKRHRQRRTYPPGDHPTRRYLAGGRTSRKTSVPARRTWRQAEATRHRTLANLVLDLTNQCRMPSMPPPPPHQPQGCVDAVPFATPVHHVHASAPGKAPPRGLAGACAKSGARETTPDTPQRAADRETSPGAPNPDDDSFDAFMESCSSDPHADATPAVPRIRPEPRRDHTEGTPLTVSRPAHL